MESAKERFNPTLEALGCICRALFTLNIESCCSKQPGTKPPARSSSPRKSLEKTARASPRTTANVAATALAGGCVASCCSPANIAGSSSSSMPKVAMSPSKRGQEYCDDKDSCCDDRNSCGGSDTEVIEKTSCINGCCKEQPSEVDSCCSGERESKNCCGKKPAVSVAVSEKSAAYDAEKAPAAVSAANSGLTRIALTVQGMTCSGCETKLSRSLASIPGVTNIVASLVLSRVQFDVAGVPSASSPEAVEIVARLKRMTGFEFEPIVDVDSAAVIDVVVPGEGLAKVMLDAASWPKGVVGVTTKTGPGPWWTRLWLLFQGRRGTKLPAQIVLQIAYDPLVVGARKVVDLSSWHGLPLLPPPEQQTPTLELAPAVTDASLAAGARHVRSVGLRTLLSAVLTVPVLVLAWAPLPARDDRHTTLLYGAVSLVLATFVQVLVAGPFYPAALRSLLFARVLEMDLLVVLSTSAAYVFSVVSFALLAAGRPVAPEGTLSAGHGGEGGGASFFFETSTLLVTLIMLGRWVAAYARQRAVESIGYGRASLQARMALLVVESDETGGITTKEIDARLLQHGDVFRVTPSSRIVTDGTVVAGTTEVDESLLTGEALPVAKRVGSPVVAGSLNSGSGATIDVRLARLPGSNTVAAIAGLVDRARLTRPPVQELADRVAGWFVPVVCVLTAITFCAWLGADITLRDRPASEAAVRATTYAIAVLIVACPCAIGLAVPMVVVVAGGVAADRGVVFRTADVIERAMKVSHVVFDKTGTLTSGVLRVVSEEWMDGDEAATMKEAVRRLLEGINHPASRAVAAHLTGSSMQEKGTKSSVTVTDIKSLPSKGVTGSVHISGPRGAARFPIRAGNAHWLGTASHPTVSAFAAQGKSTFCVVTGTDSTPVLRAVLVLEDTLRPEAAGVVAELRKRNIAVSLVSGDDKGAVDRVAIQLGIEPDHVRSRASPAQKADYVRALINSPLPRRGAEGGTKRGIWERIYKLAGRISGRHKKPVVMFVGDGTNDAVALAAASIGVHISPAAQPAQGNDASGGSAGQVAAPLADAVAQSAADVVLLHGSASLSSASASAAPTASSAGLRGLVVLLNLSSAVVRRIAFNFAWAFTYNVFAVLLAGGAFANGGVGEVVVRVAPAYAGIGEIVSVLPVVVVGIALRWVRLGWDEGYNGD